jgi:hypothetical protein
MNIYCSWQDLQERNPRASVDSSHLDGSRHMFWDEMRTLQLPSASASTHNSGGYPTRQFQCSHGRPTEAVENVNLVKTERDIRRIGVSRTLSSQPPTARNIPLGCQTAFRMPKPGSGSGVKVACKSPAKDMT